MAGNQRNKTDTKAYAEKDLQYMGQLAQIDIMKTKALMDMNIPHRG
jgi:hypothetical protein